MTKGVIISPPNLVTQSLLNVFETIPPSNPKVITVSSTGVTEESHKALPLPHRVLYPYLLDGPLKDKRGAEQIYARVADWPWEKKNDAGSDILPDGWTDRVPHGQHKNLLVIRPALLINCESLGEKTPEKKDGYRVQDGDMKGAYKISRNDVAHFIVEGALKRWDEWAGRCVSIAY